MTLCGRHTSRSPGPSVDNAERSDYAREIACEEANFRKFSELKKAREVAVVTIVIIVA